MTHEKVRLIRYPGGKQRILNHIMPWLPSRQSLKGKFVEPFVGSGAVFFALNPKCSLLTDINEELINLYRGIRRYPLKVWQIFKAFPRTKKAYYDVRCANLEQMNLPRRAARTLYLNRTCFKGMWRHNTSGQFNVGYGGQDRRWVITRRTLLWVSKKLQRVSLKCCDFEQVIDARGKQDFLFLDPPYRPGEREMIHDHYSCGRFTFQEHKRLRATLRKASARGVRWAMTTSAHPEIVGLFSRYHVLRIPRGTGRRIGVLTRDSGEVLIRNYPEVLK